MRARLLSALFGLLGCVSLAAAQTINFPALSGRVVDEAGILDSPARAALTRSLADLEDKTTDQLVVVTVKSLQGNTIETYGYQLGRHWQIGQQGKNNGVLLIVAPGERKVRIDVGYGLEWALTDAIAKFIVETSILPRFRANDYPGGIKRGVEDVIQVLTGDSAEYQQRARNATSRHRDNSPSGFFKGILTQFSLVFGIVFILLGLKVMHALLIALGVTRRRPRDGFWYWADHATDGGSSGGGFSGGGSSGGGFSGGGGSFGGGGASGSW